jgi:hypothetical protein
MENKEYRVYYNRIEEFYIDIQARDEPEAREKWEKSDLQEEEETGNSNTIITEVEEN